MRVWRTTGLVRLTIPFKAGSVRIGQVNDTEREMFLTHWQPSIGFEMFSPN